MKKLATGITSFTRKETISVRESVRENIKVKRRSKFAVNTTISIIIALLTIITATNTATAQNNTPMKEQYKDIAGHWSREYVHKLTQMEIVSGYGDGRFGPEDTLKVDEFLKMTLRAMGHKVEEGIKYWAEPYIELAKKVEIIDENEFTDYRRPILREEAARIIVKAAL
ncbi:MAG TPA: S-layer homology domain-containing protein, partial [Clostridiaceae bacterium]|nr:S-layer homology domain-containing protein [Clostridiaceae bacterium]